MSERIDHAETVALRKIGNPEGFSVCGWERLDDGSVMYRMQIEGPRDKDNYRTWTGSEKKACITDAELKAEVARYESETGLCAKCQGSAQEWWCWSVEDGNRYRPCRKCNATGKAQQ